MLADAYVK